MFVDNRFSNHLSLTFLIISIYHIYVNISLNVRRHVRKKFDLKPHLKLRFS